MMASGPPFFGKAAAAAKLGAQPVACLNLIVLSNGNMLTHHTINYIEMPAVSLEATKAFFQKVFGWQFVHYGPDYCSFTQTGVDGGFFRAEQQINTASGSALVVIYSEDLEATLAAVQEAGGPVSKAIFSFPGGRRFHFTCPSGNEFAVWST